jgi:hypothetical protein
LLLGMENTGLRVALRELFDEEEFIERSTA